MTNPERKVRLKPAIREGQVVHVIGCGGIGSPVARGVSLLLSTIGLAGVRSAEVEAGLGRDQAQVGANSILNLIDGDSYSVANQQRVLCRLGPKASNLRADLLHHLTDSALTIIAIDDFVTPANVASLIQEDSICLLCVDSHASRQLVHSHLCRLKSGLLISGGNDAVEEDGTGGSYGNVLVHIRRNGADVVGPITRFHPEIEVPDDKLPTDLSCSEQIFSQPQIMATNQAVASAMISTLVLALSGNLTYAELALDVAQARMTPVQPLGSSVGFVAET